MTAKKQTAPESREQILDLEDVLSARAAVEFRTPQEREEGKPAKRYELRTPEEFSIEEEHLYRSRMAQHSELRTKSFDDLTKAEKAKLTEYLHFLFNRVIIAPDEIKRAFNDRQRQQVVALFTTALLTADATAIERALPTQMQARIGSTTAS